MSVTITRSTSSYDPTTDSMTVTSSEIVGAAVRVRGNPIVYQRLGLVESEAPTLLFAPRTYGDTPAPGDSITWGQIQYTVRDVNPLAPDGVTIQAHLVIAR